MLAGRKSRMLGLSLAVLGLDVASKLWVAASLPEFATRSVIPGFLNLTHVRNRGVAFGLFDSLGSYGPPVLIAAGVGALVVVWLYFRQTESHERLLLWALALILGGALGNLLDRIVNGAVTDFVDVFVGTYHWHTFNVADSAITVGVGLMLLDFLRHRNDEASEADG
jgi:signal peptidase II